MVLLLFDRLENAARAATETVPLGPSACDLMDRRHLSLARESAAFYDQLIPAETEAVLLVEFEGDSIAEVRNRMLQIIDRVRRKKRLAFHALQTQDRVEMEWYGRLAQKVVPTLYRMKGPSRPIPFIEDLAVPPRGAGRFSGANAERAQAARGDRVAVCAMPATANCTSGRFSICRIRPTRPKWRRWPSICTAKCSTSAERSAANMPPG